MKYEEFEERLLAEFGEIFKHRPRGTLSTLLKTMNLAPNYFRQWKAGTKINMVRLVEALEHLGIEPFVFFARALHPEGSTEDPLDPVDDTSGLSSSPDVIVAREILSKRGITLSE